MSKSSISNEVKVGIFVCAGVVLTMAAILVLGSNDNLTQRKAHFVSHFPDIEGLVSGAKIVMNGLQVGTVDDISFDSNARDVLVKFNVIKSSSDWIRTDATTQIATQGVLGDKFVSLSPGSKDKPPIADGAEIPTMATKSLTEFLSRSDQLMESIKSVATSLDSILKSFDHNGRSDTIFGGLATTSKNLGQASEKLNRELDNFRLKNSLASLDSILEKIDNGTGTLGALVNDPSLFDDAKSFVGGANRNRIVRNLVRQTIKKSEEDDAAAAAQQPPKK